MNERPAIGIFGPIRGAVAAFLREFARPIAGPNDEPLRPGDLERALAADALLVERSLRLDAPALARFPNLRAIAAVSVGHENIDLDACRARGIVVTNSSGSLSAACADLTFALAVMSRRRIGVAMAAVRDGGWPRGPFPLERDMAGATLGIFGMGEIGCAVAVRALAADMRVIYNNRTQRGDDARTHATYRTFDQLVRESDVLVVLAPLTDATRRIFTDDVFARMKPAASFVNAARGGLVDHAALARALAAGTIAAAGLDVTDPEPLPPDHPLMAMPSVVITPHMASSTIETRERMSMLAARNLAAFFRGEPPLTPV